MFLTGTRKADLLERLPVLLVELELGLDDTMNEDTVVVTGLVPSLGNPLQVTHLLFKTAIFNLFTNQYCT